jgi:hypothetical protein
MSFALKTTFTLFHITMYMQKVLQLSLKDSILLPIESFEVINFSVLQPQAQEHI